MLESVMHNLHGIRRKVIETERKQNSRPT